MNDLDFAVEGATLPDGKRVTIVCRGENIASVDAASDLDVHLEADLFGVGGALVVPGFVEGHIHLDKSFIGDRWVPHRPAASIHERIAIERELLAAARPIEERATALIELALAHGSTAIRTHVDIDPEIGFSHFHAICRVRERFDHLVRIQIVAFPQHGLLTNPGTLELLDAAMREGADVIGGLDPASFDRDVKGHLDAVFTLAQKHGAPLDIHLHDPDQLGIHQLEEIADRTAALGMQGKVVVSHAYALGMVSADDCDRTAERLGRAGVAIMTNAPGDGPFPPVLRLRRHGVTVFGGSDNIRDAWWPYGDADMLNRAMMIGYRSGFYTDDQLEIALDCVTYAGAGAIGLTGYGLLPGCRADFVCVRADGVPEAVVRVPRGRLVVSGGRLVGQGLDVSES